MTIDTIAFISSLFFLLGVVLVLASTLPPFKTQKRMLFGLGFLLSGSSIVFMAVMAIGFAP